MTPVTDAESDGLSRRALLRLAGAGIAGSLAGCGMDEVGPTPTPTSGPEGTTADGSPTGTPPVTLQDTVVDVVEAGADRTGTNSINHVLDRVQSDDVAVYFPRGRYFLDPISLSGSNWSLVGDDATLVVPGYVNHRYLAIGGEGWTVDGFTIDVSADGAAPVNYLGGTNWEFRNVRVTGQVGDPQTDTQFLYPAVGSQDGSGLIENVVATDGSAAPGESSNRGFSWFGQNNQGTLTWRGCHLAQWANNTLYGANSAGRLIVEDCLFENTNVGVRIGGNTVVRNSVWKQDGRVPIQRWTGDRNGRGLWINSNQYVPGEILVEGCDFVMTGSDATSAISAPNRVDDVVVRNSRIRQSNGWGAITIPGRGRLVVEGSALTGDAPKPAVAISNRDGSTFRGICVKKPGVGLRIENSSGCRVTESALEVGGEPFSFANARVETSDISHAADCSPARTDWQTSTAVPDLEPFRGAASGRG